VIEFVFGFSMKAVYGSNQFADIFIPPFGNVIKRTLWVANSYSCSNRSLKKSVAV